MLEKPFFMMCTPTQGKEFIILEGKKENLREHMQSEIETGKEKEKKKVTSLDPDHLPAPGISIS